MTGGPVVVLDSALDHWQPPGALLRTLVALVWQIDPRDAWFGQDDRQGPSPRAGSTPPRWRRIMTISAADEKPDLVALDEASQRYLSSQQHGRPAAMGSGSAGRS
jgi:hypothetical protein